MNLGAALLIRALPVLALLGLLVGCEKSRLDASRDEYRELMSRAAPEDERVIALARFIERHPDRKTNPDFDQACKTIGRHHARAGRPALAAAWFERGVAAAPDDPWLLNLAGYHYAEQGAALDRAIAMISRAVHLAQEGDFPPRQIAFFKDSLGWAYRGRGDLGTAITLLAEAHDLAPEVAIIEKHLAQARRDFDMQRVSGGGVPESGERPSSTTDRREVDVGGDFETMIEDGDTPDVDAGSQGTGVELP